MVSIENGAGLPISRNDLLDQLTREIGCEYLSNLRHSSWSQHICKALMTIVPEEFTLAAWNDAIHYITGHNLDFQTPFAAFEYLLEFTKCNSGKENKAKN